VQTNLCFQEKKIVSEIVKVINNKFLTNPIEGVKNSMTLENLPMTANNANSMVSALPLPER
jgi:hypothetical protein